MEQAEAFKKRILEVIKRVTDDETFEAISAEFERVELDELSR